MKLENITFVHALTLGPVSDDDRVQFTIEPNAPKNKAGVYVVLEGEVVRYIGSYQSGVIRRWASSKKGKLDHFKRLKVADSLKSGATVKVYAQDESEIKSELQLSENQWVNSAGIEARLIAIRDPQWNKLGKKKRNN